MIAKRIVTLLVLLAALCSTAWAAPRNFPANTLRGTFTATVYPQVVINGKTMQLAPGAKIYSQQNTILMHTNLTGSALVVNYTVDNMGFVNRVWILTNEEAALTLPTQQ
ncbi:MAG TPA: hypothetical protein VF472_19705 [Burkholderiaceae bacterium]